MFSKHSLTHRINNNRLEVLYKGEWGYTSIAFNVVITSEIEKVPKRKEFTDDELDILKKIPKKYKWCARDKNKALYFHTDKPYKLDGFSFWRSSNRCVSIEVFNDLFPTILWEDEEPVFIDDYVER